MSIPDRIDEAQSAIPEATIDVVIDTQLSALQTKQDGLMEQKAALLTGDTATADARKRVAASEAALAEVYLNRAAEANQGTQASIAVLQGQLAQPLHGRLLSSSNCGA